MLMTKHNPKVGVYVSKESYTGPYGPERKVTVTRYGFRVPRARILDGMVFIDGVYMCDILRDRNNQYGGDKK